MKLVDVISLAEILKKISPPKNISIRWKFFTIKYLLETHTNIFEDIKKTITDEENEDLWKFIIEKEIDISELFDIDELDDDIFDSMSDSEISLFMKLVK